VGQAVQLTHAHAAAGFRHTLHGTGGKNDGEVGGGGGGGGAGGGGRKTISHGAVRATQHSYWQQLLTRPA
jgi:hypothetical protein